MSRPGCFKINQIAPNQPHLVRRNLFLKDEPEEVNFGTHSSVILIAVFTTPGRQHKQTAKLRVEPFQGGDAGRTGRNFPPH